MIVFTTERLLVRHLEDDDFEALYALCSDPEVTQYMGDNNPLTSEQTAEWIKTSQKNYLHQGYGCFAITSRPAGPLIGFGGLVRTHDSTGAEIIYAFSRSSRGHGLATEFSRAMLAAGFEHWHLPRIEATIDPRNTASIRVIEKLAMTFVRSGVDEHNLPTLFYALENPALHDRESKPYGSDVRDISLDA